MLNFYIVYDYFGSEIVKIKSVCYKVKNKVFHN